MRKSRAIVERNPLVSFFVFAYGLTWPVIPLVSVSPLLGLPALFGPALAAIIVVAVSQGKTGLKDLLSRLVLISTLLHGSINFSQGFFLGGLDPAREYWLLAAVYGAATLAVALMFGPNLAR
jgi:hypothetical protein